MSDDDLVIHPNDELRKQTSDLLTQEARPLGDIISDQQVSLRSGPMKMVSTIIRLFLCWLITALTRGWLSGSPSLIKSTRGTLSPTLCFLRMLMDSCKPLSIAVFALGLSSRTQLRMACSSSLISISTLALELNATRPSRVFSVFWKRVLIQRSRAFFIKSIFCLVSP